MEVNNDLQKVIKHLAIIMDGNGRWAKKRGLKRVEGHKAGAKTVTRMVDLIEKYQIKYLTLYAFSTENWKRPKNEITALMGLLKEFLEINKEIFFKKDIRLRTIGRINDIPLIPRQILKNLIKKTENNKSGELILALSYSGRSEIVDATTKISNDVKEGLLKPEQINEELFSSYLYAPDIPDPDLMIRTSGEFRISNFLLWELSYSEIWITDTLWPDFGEKELVEALKNYKKRNRRFGGV